MRYPGAGWLLTGARPPRSGAATTDEGSTLAVRRDATGGAAYGGQVLDALNHRSPEALEVFTR